MGNDKEQPKKVNETWKLIQNRRSLRSYSSRQINDEDKQKIIKGAMRAPTGSNMMMYSMLEVDDPEKIATIVSTCDELEFIGKAPLIIIFLADMQRWDDFYQASGVTEMCKRMDLEYQPPLEGDLLISICDAMIAAQNSCIVAESLGMGTCYIGDIIEQIEIVRQTFKLPQWAIPITMVCYGYPKRPNKPLHLGARYAQKYVHFKNEYKHLSKEEFDDMYSHITVREMQPGAQNLGQHYYLDFVSTSFVMEINRSAKLIIDDWLKKDNPFEYPPDEKKLIPNPVTIMDSCEIRVDSEKCIGCWECVNLCPNECHTKQDNKKSGLRDDYYCFACYSCVYACPKQCIEIVFKF